MSLFSPESGTITNGQTGTTETADFDLNLIPGLREAVKEHVKFIHNDMQGPDWIQGDTWELITRTKFTLGQQQSRSTVDVKRPKLTCDGWTSKTFGWVRENETIRIEKTPEQQNLPLE